MTSAIFLKKLNKKNENESKLDKLIILECKCA